MRSTLVLPNQIGWQADLVQVARGHATRNSVLAHLPCLWTARDSYATVLLPEA